MALASLVGQVAGRPYMEFLSRDFGSASDQSDSTIAHPNGGDDTSSVVGYQMWVLPWDIALHGYVFFDATTFAGTGTVRMKAAMHTAHATTKVPAIYNASTLCELEIRAAGADGANLEAAATSGLANAGKIVKKALAADVILSAGVYFMGIILESRDNVELSAGSFRTNFFARGLVDYNLGNAAGTMTAQTYSTFVFTDNPAGLAATTAATVATIQSLLWCTRI